MARDAEHIGATLRRTRRQREDSQERVAQLLGMTQPTFSRVERGLLDPPRPTWAALSRYLSEPGAKVTTADVAAQVERYNLEARERELLAELAAIREQLDGRHAVAS